MCDAAAMDSGRRTDTHSPERQRCEIRGVSERLAEAKWDREWLCGWCDVTSSTNERTAIPAFLPRAAVTYTFRLMFPLVLLNSSHLWWLPRVR